MASKKNCASKADSADMLGRFREIISDPINLLIERDPFAGVVRNNHVILHNGNRVPIVGPEAYYGPFSQVLVVNRGVHEPLEEFVFQEVMKVVPEAPRMIELGAYWAHYSMWLKKRRPAATVTMVEPDAGNLAAGRSNFKLNGFVGEFVQGFVGKGHWELDAGLSARNIAHLDILHADIQGNELELLASGADSLSRAAVDYLFVSTHSQALHTGVVKALSEKNYRVEVSSDFEAETTSFDGFVFASSPKVAPVFDNLAVLGREQINASSSNELLQAVERIRRSLRR